MQLLIRLGAMATAVLLTAGCFAVEQEWLRANPSRATIACLLPYGIDFLDADSRVFRQGARIKMTARRNMQPAGTRDVPVGCVSGWSVSGPARFDPSTRTVIINENAPAGADVTVTAYYGTQPLRARMTVIARDTIVLTGTRSQKAANGCENADPVKELEFDPTGRFFVTFQPFESYRDFWGTYKFDPRDGSLELKTEDGNFVPPALDLEGSARIEGSSLILEGLFLGSRNGFVPQGSCRYTF